MLSGLRVVDFTHNLSGPFCSMLLADLGADVIKVERPGGGDPARTIPPFVDGRSGYFFAMNRGKRGIAVDLKSEPGREVFRRLLTRADVLVENWRPGLLDRLGFGYAAVSEWNPRLIYTSVSGFGQTGPYRSRGAYDMIVQAMGGTMSVTGEPGRDPVRVGFSIGDTGGALYAAIGTLAALESRNRTGKGQRIDVAMLDAQVSMMGVAITDYSITGRLPQRLGSRHPSVAPTQSYRTRDGHIIIAVGTSPRQWPAFCDVIGRPELCDDSRFAALEARLANVEALNQILEPIVVEKTTREWLDLLMKAEIPCAPINTVADVFEDPQVAARGMLVQLPSGPSAESTMTVAGAAIKASRDESHIGGRAPEVGEHTAEVLTELGYTHDEIEALRTANVIGA